MVFFQKQLTRKISVKPEHLGPALEKFVRDQLTHEVEGMPIDNAGHIITVVSVTDGTLEKGMIDHLTGNVKYNISFNALLFRPFKNEVLDATVKAVSDVGFFAEAGPLSVFVSRVHIPGDMEYSAADMSYANPDAAGAGSIRVESSVRLKIIGSSVQATNMCAIGSINEPFLGPQEGLNTNA